ncbi:MAG TPA: GDP-mannose 4,6-dehydratase [Terriglobales bacterium]|nr:GDP-mannose 4,6-dehydratase [Terriglobales bacterium]
MRSLITGANGFVGKHLADLLLGLPESSCWAFSTEEESRLPNQVVYRRVDIRDRQSLADFLHSAQPHHIYHLAAISTLSAASDDKRIAFDVNVWGTSNLLESASKLSERARVLNISSSQVYGSAAGGITEQHPLRPANMYAVTKAMAELWSGLYATGVDAITARAFNHTGPGQPAQFVLSSLAQQVAAIEAGISQPVIRAGDLSVERDFTDVRDVVKAYALLAERGKPGAVYNVCSGRACRLSDLLEILLSEAGIKASVERDPAKNRTQDPRRIYGDNSKLREATGWAPVVPIEQTMHDLLNFWRSEIGHRSRV